MTPDLALQSLHRLVGSWITDATHPAVPGVVVHGTAIIEWLEGQRFLMVRARTDHPDFPDSLSIIGNMAHDRVHGGAGATVEADDAASMQMHYYDSRGVFRRLDMRVDGDAWHIWRDAPGFSQRFTGSFADGGATIAGRWQLRRDDVHWVDDLEITYRRTG